MQSRQGQVIDTGGQVLAFHDENAAVIGPTGAPSRTNLDGAIAQLNTMAVTQNGGTIQSVAAMTMPQKQLGATQLVAAARAMGFDDRRHRHRPSR